MSYALGVVTEALKALHDFKEMAFEGIPTPYGGG